MLMVDEANLGTPERAWLDFAVLDELAPMRWPHPERVVVVAPHPDDEVLGVGGSLRSLALHGSEIQIVAVTDGEGSHPGSVAMTPAALARARARETRAALRRLGLSRAGVIQLRHPDGGVADHHDELTRQLADLLDQDTLCLSTWRHDGHPDHDASGSAALAACAATGARLVEFPVWAWHWSAPDGGDGPAMPWGRARRHALDGPARRAKGEAIEAFVTQIAPIGPKPADRAVLPGPVLARFRRSFEVLFEVAPLDRDHSRPTAIGSRR